MQSRSEFNIPMKMKFMIPGEVGGYFTDPKLIILLFLNFFFPDLSETPQALTIALYLNANVMKNLMINLNYFQQADEWHRTL